MPVERSAGIILFRNKNKREYLIIRSSRKFPDRPEFWDFPKGRLEAGETGLEAAKREAREEVGISEIEIIPDFKDTVQYFTRREGKSIPKFVALFLAQTNVDNVILSWEHDLFEWLPYEKAQERISVSLMKKALEKAEEFLQKNNPPDGD